MKKQRIVAWLLCVTQILFPLNGVFGADTVAKVKAESSISTSYGEVVCIGEAAPEKETYAVLKSANQGMYSTRKYSAGVQVDNVQSEFNMESAQFGKVIDTQMRNYLNNSKVNAAYLEKPTAEDDEEIETYIAFDLTDYDFMVSNDLLVWVMDAISLYPSLASSMSYVRYSYYPMEDDSRRLAYIYIGSPLKESEIRSKTLEYESALENLVKKPLNDNEMTDVEKILYVHDRIVNIADYKNDGTMRSHLPLAILLDSYGVCQSYGNVFNHAMTMLGYDCVLLCSENHSWNAIRLGGKWYYIDVTWDDPISNTSLPLARAYASHEYMLEQENDFEDSHMLDEKYEAVYGSITDNFGNAYDNFFPKKKDINRSMWYYDGKWYYAQNGVLYTWQSGSSSSRWLMSAGYDSKRNVVEFYDKLYYSGSDGLYEFDGESSKRINSYNIDDIYLGKDSIIYVSNDREYSYGSVPTAVPTAEPTAVPTPKPTATPTVAPTATPTVKPTAVPTLEPTVKPTAVPTATPTAKPTAEPTPIPTVEPTATPTIAPTATPTVEPTPEPTVKPTAEPTAAPTEAPTSTPDPDDEDLDDEDDEEWDDEDDEDWDDEEESVDPTPHPKGHLLNYEKGIYRVVIAENWDDEEVVASVSFVKPVGNVKSFKVPDTIDVDDYVYDVVSIEPKAFKGQKSLVKVTISDTVESIGKKAFAGCKRLKNIIIESEKFTKSRIGTDCFKGVSKKAFMKVPKKKMAVYAKLFKKKGFKGKVIK